MSLTSFFKRKPTPPPVAPPKPAPPLPVFDPLDNNTISPAARQMLAEWLDLPTTKTVLRLMAGQTPSSTVTLATDPALNAQREARRLHLLQGWDLYHRTLLSLRHSPQTVAKNVIETYPTQTES